MESEGRRKDDRRKMLFWNIAGTNKDKDCWKFIESFDFISLCETWLEKKDWIKLRNRLPTSFKLDCSFAKRDKVKGRAKGGMIIGIKKNWGKKISIEKDIKKGIVISRIARSKITKDIVVVSLYYSGNWDKLDKILSALYEEEKEKIITIGATLISG